jgi:hypothetical protein
LLRCATAALCCAADFDIDCILLAEHGLSPGEETELRKMVTGEGYNAPS